MPLLKRKAFPLVDPPKDLRPNELVWQIRFTKEIFQSYTEYLERVNLYRRRVWTCKATGKTSLTYEEALVSEHRAFDRIRQIPKELMAPVLHMIQFRTLRLHDLVTVIYEKLKERFFEGEELHGRRENSVYPCKIIKVLKVAIDDGGLGYEVGWLDTNKKVTCTSIEKAANLIRKKLPLSRLLLKSFIRESTSQNVPWVVHDSLAREHGISTEPPEELRDKIIRRTAWHDESLGKESTVFEDRKLGKKKRPMLESDGSDMEKIKKTKTGDFSKTDQTIYDGLTSLVEADVSSSTMQEEEQPKVETITYPIDDLLVKPGQDDPVFPERPVPSTNFIIPMDSVGDLLMVWNFCSSFSKLLHLSPFSLEWFESAVACEGDSNLIIEVHSMILNLIIKDHGEYYTFIEKKRRKLEITSKNWADYLCDFLEMEAVTDLSAQIGKIRRGCYCILDVRIKLEILGVLVYWALMTDAIREQLDDYVEKQQTLNAKRREEDLEDLRKIKEEKQLKEANSNHKNTQGKVCLDHGGQQQLSSTHIHGKTKDMAGEVDAIISELDAIRHSESRGGKYDILASRRANMKQKLEAKIAMERAKEAAMMEEHKTRAEKRRKLREEKEAKDKEDRLRKQNEQRQLNFDRAIEKLFIRISPLGKDRDYNWYWFFQQEGRIFVESVDHKQWGFYTSKEELDGLIGSLNLKGERERALQNQLEKNYQRICTALPRRSKDMEEMSIMDTAVLRRSVRVSVLPKDNVGPPFLHYVNKLRV